MIEALPVEHERRHTRPLVDWRRPSERATLRVAAALDRVRQAPTILRAIQGLPALLTVVDEEVVRGTAAAALLDPLRDAIDDDRDTVTALAAVRALARLPGPVPDGMLGELLFDRVPGYAEHALWGLAGRSAGSTLLRLAAGAVARGSMAGMHAQHALAGWAQQDPGMVLAVLEATLDRLESPTARRYLTESIGLVPGRAAVAALERVACDAMEHVDVRAAAIAAFADRPQDPLPTLPLAGRQEELVATVRATRTQRLLTPRGRWGVDQAARGMRVAQLHLGEAGGVATLLPQLGAWLGSSPRITEAVTIVRADGPLGAVGSTAEVGHRLASIGLHPGEGAAFGSGWPSIVAITRGIRAALLAAPLPDVLHLRMADPGSLAGARIARQLGIPFVFTLSPDPHGPMAAAEASGSLDRRTFAGADRSQALWYRVDLVARLARGARQLVLFPRAGGAEEVQALAGIDLAAGPPRHVVVPEGIDVARLDAAANRLRRAVIEPAVEPPVIGELQAAIARLPRHRHGLPLVVSVGRLHDVKGMSRLVKAFALDTDLSDRANLVIVGGQLEAPAAAETAELGRIRQLVERDPALGDRVVLLGHRPLDDVALVLAAARRGCGRLVGPSGAYACASAKEEFGLAILEAMAAGLPAVAPAAGGPATFVEHGVTGVLVETTDVVALAAAVRRALDLAHDARTAEKARAMVDERYTLARMARDLSAVYRIAAGPRSLAHGTAPRSERAA